MTGGPGKEYRTNTPPPTGRVQERSKGDTMCPSTSQNPSHWHPCWLNKACTTRKDSESEWLSKDNAETNPITIRPETASHMAEQFSWVPLPCCSLLGCLLPLKSLALSACVSSDNSFLSVRQEPALGAPSYNTRRRLSSSKRLYLFSLGREQGYLEKTATASVHIPVHTWRSVGPAQWCNTSLSSHSLASHQGTRSRKKWNQHKSAARSPLGRAMPQTKGGDCYHT